MASRMPCDSPLFILSDADPNPGKIPQVRLE